jgi:hypothetical protein
VVAGWGGRHCEEHDRRVGCGDAYGSNSRATLIGERRVPPVRSPIQVFIHHQQFAMINEVDGVVNTISLSHTLLNQCVCHLMTDEIIWQRRTITQLAAGKRIRQTGTALWWSSLHSARPWQHASAHLVSATCASLNEIMAAAS